MFEAPNEGELIWYGSLGSLLCETSADTPAPLAPLAALHRLFMLGSCLKVDADGQAGHEDPCQIPSANSTSGAWLKDPRP